MNENKENTQQEPLNTAVQDGIPKGMKKCKTCGKVIAKSAKRCPACGAKQKGKAGLIIGIVVLLIIIAGVGGSGGKSKKESSEPVSPTNKATSESVSSNTTTTSITEDEVTGSSEQENQDDELNYEITNTIFKVYKPEYSDDYRYDALVEIENKGTKGIYLTDEQFDIEDKEGHLIQTDDFLSSAPDVILPGEKGYLYNNFGSSMESVSDPDNVNLVPHFTVKATDKAPHEYPVTDTSVRDDSFGKTVAGRITNDTSENISYIYVNVLYYNSDGQCIGVGGTSVTEVAPNETKSFEISGIGAPHGFEDDLIDYKVVARDSFYGW